MFYTILSNLHTTQMVKICTEHTNRWKREPQKHNLDMYYFYALTVWIIWGKLSQVTVHCLYFYVARFTDWLYFLWTVMQQKNRKQKKTKKTFILCLKAFICSFAGVNTLWQSLMAIEDHSDICASFQAVIVDQGITLDRWWNNKTWWPSDILANENLCFNDVDILLFLHSCPQLHGWFNTASEVDALPIGLHLGQQQ